MFNYECVCVLLNIQNVFTQDETYTATKTPMIIESYFLSNLGEDTPRQQLQVGGQSASLYHLLQPPFLVGRAKQDIVHQSGILDPGLLWHKGKGTLDRKTLRVSHKVPRNHAVVQAPAM